MALSGETSNSKFQTIKERQENIVDTFKHFRQKCGPPFNIIINPLITATITNDELRIECLCQNIVIRSTTCE